MKKTVLEEYGAIYKKKSHSSDETKLNHSTSRNKVHTQISDIERPMKLRDETLSYVLRD